MEKGIKLALARIRGLKVTLDQAAYNELVVCADKYYESYQDTAPGSVPRIETARSLFKKIGLDPTKRRPSSEALLRRALKKTGFYSINNLVDTGNWCSLEFLLPICVYDGSNVIGEVSARLGMKDEGYIAIDGNYLDLSQRYLVYDELGAMGSPIKDSLRTRVTETTQEAVLLIYAPAELTDEILQKYLDIFISRTVTFCGGELLLKKIIEIVID
ncbi:MAG: hypothetical protein K9N06_09670 [Candidatus Cloacimonetes bacterium]|nr:hypothetical protein [Candidatus Cloacimonadota bacterium]